MNTRTTTVSDDQGPHGRTTSSDSTEPGGEWDDQCESRQAGPETEDRDPEEAGYGYGV